ncbi:MAG: hypothetical protein DMD46_04180 [Gemmatimonadetes bacterium]|nr:MAG: hypothetical protein DMD46_04180 [Gemmatimonadota bacterium]
MTSGNAVSGNALIGNVVLFGRALRRAGLSVDADQTRRFADVLALLGFDRRGDVKAAGRTVFVRRREERALYDAAFDLFWRRSTAMGRPSGDLPRLRQQEGPRADVSLGPEVEEVGEVREIGEGTTRVGASGREQLRTADFAELTPAEAREAAAMLVALKPRLPLRPSRRRRVARRGARLAARPMLRQSLGAGGEAVVCRFWQRRTRKRPIALICDISGSMERYSRFLLRFAHALARSGAPVEVFVFGTRLTRITRELRVRDPDAALQRVAGKVVDWSGGTRIGASLRELNRRWVRRTIRSAAVVIIVSDGWERDDPGVLGREMAMLSRSCHRLIWLDPLAGRPGFEPATQGLLASLPHVDEFLPCASVASLEALARVLSDHEAMA